MTAPDVVRHADLLVPHTRSARLLRTIERCTPIDLAGTGAVPAQHPLASGPEAPVLLAIELAAQAAAAMEAISREAAGDLTGIRSGSLVRIREARFLTGSLPVETPLHVTVRLEGAMPPLAIYRFEAALDGVPVADGVISTHAGASVSV